MFLSNGGNATLRSYRVNDMKDIPPDHIQFLESTRMWWKFNNFLFVHAGAAPGVRLDKQDIYTLLWERLSLPGINDEIHVVGHQPTVDGKPYFEQGRYHLDTGAVFGQALTACDVLTKTIWQVR